MGQRWGNIDNLLPQVALRLVSQLAYLGLFMVRRLQRLYAAFPKAVVIAMLLSFNRYAAFPKTAFSLPPCVSPRREFQYAYPDCFHARIYPLRLAGTEYKFSNIDNGPAPG